MKGFPAQDRHNIKSTVQAKQTKKIAEGGLLNDVEDQMGRQSVDGRPVRKNRTVMAHPVKKRPPIRGRINVSPGRLPVTIVVVVTQRVMATVMPMSMRSSLGRVANGEQAARQGGNRSHNGS
jgi:hypothetical protein